MKPTSWISIIALTCGLVAGVVLGRTLLKKRGVTPPSIAATLPVPKTSRTPLEPSDNSDSYDAQALRQKIADLERTLTFRIEQINELRLVVAERDEQLSALATSSVPETVAVAASTPPARRRRESYEARMERMRTEEPERYAEMQQRREDLQQRLTQLHTDRQNFLSAVDTSRMNDEQLENHILLMEALEQADAFQKRLTSGEMRSLTAEERQEGFQTMVAIRELYDQERRYLLEETGRAYGEDGTKFADYIQNVYENTSLMPRFGRGMRGSWGRRTGGTSSQAGE